MKISHLITRWAARIIILLPLFTLVSLTGCLSRPALKIQTFAFPPPATVATNAVSGDRVLGIRSLRIIPPFDGRPLVYRTGEFSYVRDPYAEFLESPAEELISPVREWLRQSGEFGAVVEPGSALKPDLLVEINISQFLGDFRQPKHPEAVLSMQFVFLEASNGIPGKAIFQKEYTRRVALSAPTAAALMAGWEEALSETLSDAASDFHLSKLNR